MHQTAFGVGGLWQFPCLNPLRQKYRPLHSAAGNANRWADTMQIEVDQNHSVYMRCWDCLMWGIPAPDNLDTCGNCGGHSVMVYYPAICPTPLAADFAVCAPDLHALQDEQGLLFCGYCGRPLSR